MTYALGFVAGTIGIALVVLGMVVVMRSLQFVGDFVRFLY